MKKFLFAAMAAAMASVASAATDDWTIKSVSSSPIKAGYTGAGTSSALLGSGYSVYYVSVRQEQYASETGTESTKQKALAGSILESLRSGKSATAAVTDAGETVLATSTMGGNGLVVPVENVKVDTGLYYKMYTDRTWDTLQVLSVVVAEGNAFFQYHNGSPNKSDPSDPNYNVDIYGNGSTQLKDSTGKGAYNGQGWYAIPEPTSGLLLLIGMAGLALKRKRA